MKEHAPAVQGDSVHRSFKTEKMGGQEEHVTGRAANAIFQVLFLV